MTTRQTEDHARRPSSDSAIRTRGATTGRSAGGSSPRRSMAPVDELTREYYRVREDPAFLEEFHALLQHYVGTSDAALRGAAAGRRGRRRAHLPQARGPDAHRRAQDQQRARPGAAGAPHGQAPHRRRDRRRAARRGDGDRLRAARPRVRRLHGRRRHGAAGAERPADATARRDGAAGGRRQPHAEGRDQRGDARLGRRRSPTRTTCWAACSARIRIR